MTGRRGARWIVLLAALAAVLGTARLGVWQLDRARQKQRIGADIAARAAMSALAPSALARDPVTATMQHYRAITVRGQWLAEHTVYLDNRQMDGRPGFYVLTPLRLAEGDAVLVQRGWLPRHRLERERLLPIETPAGEVRVVGRVAPPPSALFDLGPGGQGAIRQNLALDEFSREIGVALRPLSIQQLQGEPGVNDPLLRRWPQAQVDVGKHHGYAFQWFALSALVAGLYVWFQVLPLRRRRPR